MADIRLEISQIDRLFTVHANLLARAAQGEPDADDLAGLGSVLHSFYNGIENTILRIAKCYGGQPPEGPRWHRDLLEQMACATDARTAVLAPDTAEMLTKYLGFRHVFRHTYTFFLRWHDLEPLVERLSETWAMVRGELGAFVAGLEAPTCDEPPTVQVPGGPQDAG